MRDVLSHLLPNQKRLKSQQLYVKFQLFRQKFRHIGLVVELLMGVTGQILTVIANGLAEGRCVGVLLPNLIGCHVLTEFNHVEQPLGQIIIEILHQHVCIVLEIIIVKLQIRMGLFVAPRYFLMRWQKLSEGLTDLIVDDISLHLFIDLFGVVFNPYQFII